VKKKTKKTPLRLSPKGTHFEQIPVTTVKKIAGIA